jgi:hypothetical protein
MPVDNTFTLAKPGSPLREPGPRTLLRLGLFQAANAIGSEEAEVKLVLRRYSSERFREYSDADTSQIVVVLVLVVVLALDL